MPCGDEDRVRNSTPSSVRGLRSSETSLKTKGESAASVARLWAQCSESLTQQCDDGVC